MGKITIIGLGPGRFGLITMESWQLMQQTAHLYLRTSIHPTVEEIQKRGISFSSYDGFYEKAGSFEALYKAIAADVIRKAENGEDLVYAVPGSPLVAERTVVLLRELAVQHNVPLQILPGMSFVEVLYTRLGIDPISGLTILDAEDFAQLPADMPTGLVITQVYNQAIASDLKLSLMEEFSDDYEVIYVHNLGLADESLRHIPLYELDRQTDVDHLTSLYVPPLANESNFDLSPLLDIMKTLRSPGGCPWDIAQTHASIRKNLIEETYEVLEAIADKDSDNLCEELGDLLLQVVFHARMAEEAGEFSMQDIIDGITDKLVRRHPHIFGEITALDAGEALLAWEKAKKQEKPERQSLLDGVPQDLPALLSAQKLQKKAVRTGFAWQSVEALWKEFDEDLQKLQDAVKHGEHSSTEAEWGELLFSIVNLSRSFNIDAEMALQAANKEFKRQFTQLERQVEESGRDWHDFSLTELDDFWYKAKNVVK